MAGFRRLATRTHPIPRSRIERNGTRLTRRELDVWLAPRAVGRNRRWRVQSELLETGVDGPTDLAFPLSLRLAGPPGSGGMRAVLRWTHPVTRRLSSPRRARIPFVKGLPQTLQFENQRGALRTRRLAGRLTDPGQSGLFIIMLRKVLRSHDLAPSAIGARRAARGMGAAATCRAVAARGAVATCGAAGARGAVAADGTAAARGGATTCGAAASCGTAAARGAAATCGAPAPC